MPSPPPGPPHPPPTPPPLPPAGAYLSAVFSLRNYTQATFEPHRQAFIVMVAAAAHWHPSAVQLLFPPPSAATGRRRRRLLQTGPPPTLTVEARVHVTTVQQAERAVAGLALLGLGGDDAFTATLRDRLLPDLQSASVRTLAVVDLQTSPPPSPPPPRPPPPSPPPPLPPPMGLLLPKAPTPPSLGNNDEDDTVILVVVALVGGAVIMVCVSSCPVALSFVHTHILSLSLSPIHRFAGSIRRPACSASRALARVLRFGPP